jgi:hypothetical protein
MNDNDSALAVFDALRLISSGTAQYRFATTRESNDNRVTHATASATSTPNAHLTWALRLGDSNAYSVIMIPLALARM